MKKHANLFESIFIHNIQPMVVINRKGIVQEYNASAEQLFQYTSEEMIGYNIKKIMPFDVAKNHDTYLKAYQKTHIPHIIGTSREVKAQKKDGSFVYIFLCVTELDIEGDVFYAAVITDISSTKNTQIQNQKLIDFNLAIMQDIELIDDYNDLILKILKHFSILFGFEVGHFYHYNHIQHQLESSNLFFYACPRKYHAFIEITQNTIFKKDEGLPGTAWAENTPIYFSDIRTVTNFPRQKLSKKPLNLAGGLALPVQYHDHVLGVVEFFSDKVLHLSDDDIALIQQFSIIINRLYGQYRERRTLKGKKQEQKDLISSMQSDYIAANKKSKIFKSMLSNIIKITKTNIMESYQYCMTIENMAKTDSLTKLANRQFMHHELSKTIKKHRKKKTSFCLLMVDLNQFKFINDKYGLKIGDELLIQFSKCVLKQLKNTDFFARLGGDEFLILLETTTHSSHFNKVVSFLTELGHTPYEVAGKSIVCPMTIGVASYPSSGQSKEDLLSHVAFALYDAKRKKDPICFYSKKSKQYFEQMMKLESDFKQAFTEKEFFMLYQPQVNLKTGDIVGLEALIRWNHPTRGLLTPNHFISYLEDWDLSEKLNRYVVEKVLEDINILRPENLLKVSINVSPKVVDFKKHIADLVSLVQLKLPMLQDHNIQLEFEITESSFSLQNANDVNMALLQAKMEGIQFAMDDFGTEYSSINRLTQYQFDTVKIDKVFTQRLDKRGRKSVIAIINALIQLSKEFKFKLIAEGPETEAQVKALVDIGCVYGQGFYFYKPMSIKKVWKLINTRVSHFKF